MSGFERMICAAGAHAIALAVRRIAVERRRDDRRRDDRRRTTDYSRSFVIGRRWSVVSVRAASNPFERAQLVVRQRLGGKQKQRAARQVSQDRLQRRQLVAQCFAAGGGGDDAQMLARARGVDRGGLVGVELAIRRAPPEPPPAAPAAAQPARQSAPGALEAAQREQSARDSQAHGAAGRRALRWQRVRWVWCMVRVF